MDGMSLATMDVVMPLHGNLLWLVFLALATRTIKYYYSETNRLL